MTNVNRIVRWAVLSVTFFAGLMTQAAPIEADYGYFRIVSAKQIKHTPHHHFIAIVQDAPDEPLQYLQIVCESGFPLVGKEYAEISIPHEGQAMVWPCTPQLRKAQKKVVTVKDFGDLKTCDAFLRKLYSAQIKTPLALKVENGSIDRLEPSR